MSSINCRIYGCPVPQGRPRFQKIGNFVKPYDPQESKSWKETVKSQVIDRGGATILDGALTMTLRFHLPRPKSLPKKVTHHTKKPDVDNLVKAIKDALRGICYNDDSQIVDLHAHKEYHEQPGVTIQISKINGGQQ